MGHCTRLVRESAGSIRKVGAIVMCAVLTGCAGAMVATPPSAAEIPALEAQVKARRADPAAEVRLAAAYRAADRLPDARTLLQGTLQRDADHGAAALLLGLTYEDLGEYARARELYERYLEAGRDRRVQAQIRKRLALVQRRELETAVRESLTREASLRETPPQPRTVAVFPFLYTGDDESLRPLSRALAEMLTTDLSQTDRLSVLERAHVQMLVDEMQLGASGMVDPATAVRSGHLLGAERVVQGAITGGEEVINLDAAVVRVAASQDQALEQQTLTERDALSRLFELEKRLALGIYSSAGVELTPAERQRVNQRPTENIQALLAYGLGLEAADAGNFEQATQHFNQAVALDPNFTAAREQAQQSSELAAAAQVTTQQLAVEAVAEVAPVLDPALAIETIVPTVERRDAASESLGQEGIGRRRTILELIIRRP